MIRYTTRPIRDGEVKDVTYHFVTEEDFFALRQQGIVIEDEAYETMHGRWRYFTVNNGEVDLEHHNYILIGTLEAYEKMVEYFGKAKMLPVMIELDDGVRLERALQRERKQQTPKYEEMCRRFLADSEDFSEEKMNKAGIERRFMNDDLPRCLKEITEYLNEQL